MRKPTTRDGYLPAEVALVRQTCLYLATLLGDLRDDLVVVGGLAPSLLIDQEALAEGVEAHAGTTDLDVGITVALLDEGRYRELTAQLRDAGFEADTNAQGNLTRQRWRLHEGRGATVDFLVPPSRDGDRGGRIRNIEPDFAALIAPGLEAAFRDRIKVTLSGTTVLDEVATRDLWVCGAGAYIVLKALAFDLRGENKDAYDLFYVLRNFGAGPPDVAAALAKLLDLPETAAALAVLRRDFTTLDQVGPMRVAKFMTGGRDDFIQAEVVAHVTELLALMGST